MQRSSCVSSSFLPLRSMGLELASDEDYRTTHSRYNSTGFNRKRSSYSWNVGSFETIPRNGIKNCPRRNNPHTMDKSPCPFSRYIVLRNVSIRPDAGHERKERERGAHYGQPDSSREIFLSIYRNIRQTLARSDSRGQSCRNNSAGCLEREDHRIPGSQN